MNDANAAHLYDFDDQFRSNVDQYVRMRKAGLEPDVTDLAEELYTYYLNPAVMPMLAELQAMSPMTAEIVGTALAYLISDAQADSDVRVSV